MAANVTLLLDSDIIAYKFASAAQKDFDWDGDGEKATAVEDIADVAPQVEAYVDDLVEKLKADDLIVCLSCPSDENFRYKVLPRYKHNRVGKAKPVPLQAVKEWMRERYPTYERPTLEADDIMGILSTHPKLVPGTKIIVSEDKDLKTIPGLIFNPRKDEKPRRVSEEQADYFHLYQTLIGDTTDGYKGCPGIGPTKAQKILQPDSHPEHQCHRWKYVVKAYESKGLTEEDALVQARVARICRFTDYDFKKKEVILWTP